MYSAPETQINLWKNLWENDENHYWDRDGPSTDLGEYLASPQFNEDLRHEGSNSTQRVLVPVGIPHHECLRLQIVD